MKFLLDENISNSLYSFLKTYYETYKVGIDFRKGITDREVFQLCSEFNAILITKDCGDFGNIILKDKCKVAGIVCFRNIAGRQEKLAFRYAMDRGYVFRGHITVIEKRGSSYRVRQRTI